MITIGTGDIVLIDGLYNHLIECGAEQFISKIRHVLESEEYDTDAIEIDISFYEDCDDCNISKLIKNQSHFALVFNFIYDIKCMLSLMFI